MIVLAKKRCGCRDYCHFIKSKFLLFEGSSNPPNITLESSKLTPEPWRLTAEPNRLMLEPERLTLAPERLTLAPEACPWRHYIPWKYSQAIKYTFQ
jgi:hypothetical protein